MIFLSCLLLTGWLGSSILVAYSLTRRAESRREEPVPNLAWGKPIEFRLTTSDRENVGGWFFEGRDGLPVVLLLHGNGRCRSQFLWHAEKLAAWGYPVLMISFRAHGDSTGDYNDFGWSARKDASAAVDWLRIRKPKAEIVLWGHSLGSAATLFAAAETKTPLTGLILDCPYQDLNTALWNRLENALIPGLDVVAYVGLRCTSWMFLPGFLENTPLRAISKVSSNTKVLILTGTRDRNARVHEAQNLKNVVSGNARLVVIQDGEHSRLHIADEVGYLKEVLEFLQQCGGKSKSAGVPPVGVPPLGGGRQRGLLNHG